MKNMSFSSPCWTPLSTRRRNGMSPDSPGMRPISVISTARRRPSRTTTGSPRSRLTCTISPPPTPCRRPKPACSARRRRPRQPGAADRLCRPAAGQRAAAGSRTPAESGGSPEPASLQLERQQARVALDLQEWRQMDLLTDDVIARSPRDLNTQRRPEPATSIISPSCA